ncbi:MAG: universal stress protein [Oligoflexus sp.]
MVEYEISENSIMVAIAFDENTSNLVKFGAYLSKRLEKPLCLIHVVENPDSLDLPIAFARDVNSLTKLRILQIMEKSALNDRMKKLIDNADIPRSTKTIVISSSDIDKAIIQFATKHKAKYIVSGTKKGTNRLVPKGLSTAISLIENSSVPVFIVPQENSFAGAENDRLKMFISDSLEADSDQIVRSALEMAILLQCQSIDHVHIYSRHERNHWQTSIWKQLDLPKKSPPEKLDDQLRQILQAKIAGFESQLNKISCKYRALIVESADIAETLLKTIDENSPDIVLFGRHKMLKFKPLGIGNLPYRTILSKSQIKVIIPVAKNSG